MTGHKATDETLIAWVNGTLVTMDPEVDDQYGLLNDHCLLTRGERIEAIVPQREVKNRIFPKTYDLQGALMTPGFIDCHTHLVFGGNRSDEWEKRLGGLSYAQIAAEGGGINATVKATREESFEELYLKAERRLQSMIDEGVTCVEVKSGYGLDLESEKKILSVAGQLKNKLPVDVAPTLLAAHSVPAEFRGRTEEYVDEIIERIMPRLWPEGLFEAVDVFCEDLAFDARQTDRIFAAAQALGIPVKAHSEQLSDSGGSRLVARYNGLSSDHLEHLGEEAVKSLAESGAVAALLPTAFYFLRDSHTPPVDLLRKYKVPMAVATDFNPGTSPFTSIRLAMNMAATLFGLTAPEVMAGVTRNAARALGRQTTQGCLKVGYQANLAVWKVRRPVDLFYELSHNPLVYRVYRGLVTEVT